MDAYKALAPPMVGMTPTVPMVDMTPTAGMPPTSGGMPSMASGSAWPTYSSPLTPNLGLTPARPWMVEANRAAKAAWDQALLQGLDVGAAEKAMTAAFNAWVQQNGTAGGMPPVQMTVDTPSGISPAPGGMPPSAAPARPPVNIPGPGASQAQMIAYARAMGLGYADASGKLLVQPTQGAPKFYGVGANVLKPGSDPRSFYNPATLSSGGQLNLINRQTGQNYSTLTAALNAEELPFQFAGLEQWRQNLGNNNANVAQNPYLQNASMVGLSDPQSLALFFGGLMQPWGSGMKSPNDAYANTAAIRAMLAKRQALVPSWAPDVASQLREQGLPYMPVSLLGDPGINLNDPSKPLFAGNANPTSLFGLTQGQQGERAALRSLSAPELMLQYAKPYMDYYNRPAGSPVPDYLQAGLTMGSPVWQGGNNYLMSPTMETPGYNRWSAYGMPGDPTSPGYLTGTRVVTPDDVQAGRYPMSMLGQRVDFTADPFASANITGTGPEEQYWQNYWQNPRISPFQNLDPETLARLQALLYDQTRSGNDISQGY